MSTVIRPELSKSSKYWIDRHRYYELKHFCLQYPIWKKAAQLLDALSKSPSLLEEYIVDTTCVALDMILTMQRSLLTGGHQRTAPLELKK